MVPEWLSVTRWLVLLHRRLDNQRTKPLVRIAKLTVREEAVSMSTPSRRLR